MFKRSHSSKPSNSISNSARKKLIQDVQSNFFDELKELQRPAHNQLTIILDQLIPSGLTVSKASTHLNHQLLIYNDPQPQPIWIKLDRGNGSLIPTLYTLLKYPNLLPILPTTKLVLGKLTQGADLMVPGLLKSDLQSIQHLKKGALVSIAESTDQLHDHIWAVGSLAVDAIDLLSAQSGKAVITIHTRNDSLWNAGSQQIPAQLEIPPIPEALESSVVEQLPLQNLSIHDSSSHPTEPAIDVPSPTTPKLPADEVDRILSSALLLNLWTGQLDSELPMPASYFYSNYILPSRPFDCPRSIGVKDSSAKSLSKWLKILQKKQVLTIKEDRKGGETLIMTVNGSHPDLQGFVKYRTIADQERQDPNQPQQGDNQKQTSSTLLSCSRLTKTVITPLFKVRKVAEGLNWVVETEIDPEGLHTRQTIKEHLNTYLSRQLELQKQREKLVDQSLIQPDPLLMKALLLGHNRNDGTINKRMNRNQILELLLRGSFDPWWRLERNDELVVEKKGDYPTIVLKLKKKSGSKQATLITGLELFGIDPVQLSKELKTLCAGSTTTRPAPPDVSSKIPKEVLKPCRSLSSHNGTNDGPRVGSTLIEVECQGDQRQFLKQTLVKSCSIPRDFVQVI